MAGLPRTVVDILPRLSLASSENNNQQTKGGLPGKLRVTGAWESQGESTSLIFESEGLGHSTHRQSHPKVLASVGHGGWSWRSALRAGSRGGVSGSPQGQEPPETFYVGRSLQHLSFPVLLPTVFAAWKLLEPDPEGNTIPCVLPHLHGGERRRATTPATKGRRRGLSNVPLPSTLSAVSHSRPQGGPGCKTCFLPSLRQEVKASVSGKPEWGGAGAKEPGERVWPLPGEACSPSGPNSLPQRWVRGRSQSHGPQRPFRNLFHWCILVPQTNKVCSGIYWTHVTDAGPARPPHPLPLPSGPHLCESVSGLLSPLP